MKKYFHLRTCAPKFLKRASLVVAGALCGASLYATIEGADVLFTEYICTDAWTDNYAKLYIDDGGLSVSYNPNGHWSPWERYWESSFIHSEQIIVWQVESCVASVRGLEGPKEIREKTKICDIGVEPNFSEIWVFERVAGRLSIWVSTEEGALRRYSRFCDAISKGEF